MPHQNSLSSNAFLERVVAYLQDCPFHVIQIAQFGSGVIGVQDNSDRHEFDAYFDLTVWTPTHPEIWTDGLVPPGLTGTGIGVLQGKSRVPFPRNLDELLKYVGEQLTSILPGTRLNARPLLMEVPPSISV